MRNFVDWHWIILNLFCFANETELGGSSDDKGSYFWANLNRNSDLLARAHTHTHTHKHESSKMKSSCHKEETLLAPNIYSAEAGGKKSPRKTKTRLAQSNNSGSSYDFFTRAKSGRLFYTIGAAANAMTQ